MNRYLVHPRWNGAYYILFFEYNSKIDAIEGADLESKDFRAESANLVYRISRMCSDRGCEFKPHALYCDNEELMESIVFHLSTVPYRIAEEAIIKAGYAQAFNN